MFKPTRAFSSFSVNDLDKALAFYQETLGLKITEIKDMELMTLHLPGGGEVMVYPKGEAHRPANYTVLNFSVENVEETVDALLDKGITFEQYPDLKTDEKGISRGMGPTIAWFKDPSGNILSVLEGN